jgi:hypothetical protein
MSTTGRKIVFISYSWNDKSVADRVREYIPEQFEILAVGAAADRLALLVRGEFRLAPHLDAVRHGAGAAQRYRRNVAARSAAVRWGL